MFSVQEPTLIATFFAGIITFLSPCIFPLLPGYISFISGESLEDLRSNTIDNKKTLRLKAFLGALFFGLGFSIVFVALGATATSFGKFLKDYQTILSQIAGVIIIIFGLHMIGVFKIKFLMKTSKVNYKKQSVPFFINAFFLGFAFVLGWTPCIGPILASILFVAAQEDTLFKGIQLLSLYALGLWIPFLISALAINEVMLAIQKMGKYLIWVERVAGGLLVLVGILLLTKSMTLITSWLLNAFPFLANLG